LLTGILIFDNNGGHGGIECPDGSLYLTGLLFTNAYLSQGALKCCRKKNL
jgi:hypothetical protein